MDIKPSQILLIAAIGVVLWFSKDYLGAKAKEYIPKQTEQPQKEQPQQQEQKITLQEFR